MKSAEIDPNPNVDKDGRDLSIFLQYSGATLLLTLSSFDNTLLLTQFQPYRAFGGNAELLTGTDACAH